MTEKPARITSLRVLLQRRFGYLTTAAQSLGLPYYRVARVAAGKVAPKPEEKRRIVEALGCNPFDAGDGQAADDAFMSRLRAFSETAEARAMLHRLYQVLSPNSM